MNPQSQYNRTKLGLDFRVWTALIVALVLSVTVLAIKITINKPCQPIEITVSNTTPQINGKYFPDNRLSFTVNAKNTKDIVWDFGDGTPDAQGNLVTHAYTNTGSYFVTVTVNGKCTEFVNLVINTPTIPTEPSSFASAEASIEGPDAPLAGEQVVYQTFANSKTYEWTVLNAPEYPTQTTPVINLTFLTAGLKTLELKMDGGKVLRKNIQVLPGQAKTPEPLPVTNDIPIQQQQQVQEEQPEDHKPTAPKSIFIADQVFKDMLEAVTKGDKDASSFNQYLCDGAQTKVRENDESWTTLGEFCSKIHDKKKYQIKSVIAIRNPNDKCVLQLKVTYKKKGFLGL
jgi:PKD repeat protein